MAQRQPGIHRELSAAIHRSIPYEPCPITPRAHHTHARVPELRGIALRLLSKQVIDSPVNSHARLEMLVLPGQIEPQARIPIAAEFCVDYLLGIQRIVAIPSIASSSSISQAASSSSRRLRSSFCSRMRFGTLAHTVAKKRNLGGLVGCV